jgi:uncharacterized OB-fold protein
MRWPDTHPGERTDQKISWRSFKSHDLERRGTGLMKGKCPRCGARYYGWALKGPVHQYCDECGSELDVNEETDYSLERYMVFSYPEYRITRDWMKETMTIN